VAGRLQQAAQRKADGEQREASPHAHRRAREQGAHGEHDGARQRQGERELARVRGQQRGGDRVQPVHVRQGPPQVLRVGHDRGFRAMQCSQHPPRRHESSSRQPAPHDRSGRSDDPSQLRRRAQQHGAHREHPPRLVDHGRAQQQTRQQRAVAVGCQHRCDTQGRPERLLGVAQRHRFQQRGRGRAQGYQPDACAQRDPGPAHAPGQPHSQGADGQQAGQRTEPEDQQLTAAKQLCQSCERGT